MFVLFTKSRFVCDKSYVRKKANTLVSHTVFTSSFFFSSLTHSINYHNCLELCKTRGIVSRMMQSSVTLGMEEIGCPPHGWLGCWRRGKFGLVEHLGNGGVKLQTFALINRDAEKLLEACLGWTVWYPTIKAGELIYEAIGPAFLPSKFSGLLHVIRG